MNTERPYINILKHLDFTHNKIPFDELKAVTNLQSPDLQEVLNELLDKGWIKKFCDYDTFSTDHAVIVHEKDTVYQISIAGSEHLRTMNTSAITQNTTNFIGDKNTIHSNQFLNSSSQNNTTNTATPTAQPIIKKIFIGVIITVLGTIIAWYITSHLL